ncbi:hypothetical protein ANRL1_03287 [Anaerolineae bacterium]|nr:hypothetical protein ANRL1_03287 [Anaerolineae bacterium]
MKRIAQHICNFNFVLSVTPFSEFRFLPYGETWILSLLADCI